MQSTTLAGLHALLLYAVPQVHLKLVMSMDTDFYAWGRETNQNSGMPGTKANTSSGVLSPKMAFGATSEHQIRVGECP